MRPSLSKTPSIKKSGPRDARRYTLEIRIIDGAMTETFAKQHPVVSRTIQIRGDQMLVQLHRAIFRAFDREEEHMYEFQFGKSPRDRSAAHYVLPVVLEDPMGWEDKPTGVVTRTTLGSLNLAVGQRFYYWFDFGDDWWHQITVTAIDEQAPTGTYPKITQRLGASPPQYVDWEQENQSRRKE